MIEVVSQQDIQRWSGDCVRYPVSCLLLKMLFVDGGLPDALVKRAVLKYSDFHEPLRILDLTFGEGRFYKAFDRSWLYIVGFDIRKLKWHVEPDEFYMLPSWRWSLYLKKPKYQFDLVVADPPWAEWRRGWDRRSHCLKSKMLGSDMQIIKDAVNAAEYFNSYVLIHWKKPYIPKNWSIVKGVYFKGRSRLANLDRGKYREYSSWFGLLKKRLR